jgi:integrase
MHAEGYATSTVRRHFVIVGAAYRYAHGNGTVAANPTFAPGKLLPRVPDKLPQTFSIAQLQHMHKALPPFSNGDNRLRLLFYILALTGMRKCEALSLRWEPQPGYSYVDFDDGQFVIFGKHDKQRFVPVHPILRDLLLRQRAARAHLAFRSGVAVIENSHYRPLRSETAGRAIRELLDGVGVESEQTTHVFRKTLTTNLTRQNVRPDVIDSLFGWAPTTVRGRYYTGRVTEDQRNAILMAYQDTPWLPEQAHLVQAAQKEDDTAALRQMVTELHQLVTLQAKQIASAAT